jgi:hypothetical protein
MRVARTTTRPDPSCEMTEADDVSVVSRRAAAGDCARAGVIATSGSTQATIRRQQRRTRQLERW